MLQPIRNFQGLNRKDGGDRIQDNQFTRLTNFVHTTKGLLYKVADSSGELTSAEFPGLDAARRCSGIFRMENPYVKGTIYHMNPDPDVKLPQPTEDLVLTDLGVGTGGNLNNGGSPVAMRFCYTFVGLGMESNYNSLTRAGYVSTASTNAWDQVGHQAITPSHANSTIRITAPMYDPKYVRSINVYASRSNATQMTYIGSIFEPGGTLDFGQYIGPISSSGDAVSPSHLSAVSSATAGSLVPGQYRVAFAWLSGSEVKENESAYSRWLSSTGEITAPVLQNELTVNVRSDHSSIQVDMNASHPASSNGASAIMVFIGTFRGLDAPLTFAGILRAGQSLNIGEIKRNTNAQSHYYTPTPAIASPATPTLGNFNNVVPSATAQNGARYGFILFREDGSSSVDELLPSRSDFTTGTGTDFSPDWMGVSERAIRTTDDLHDLQFQVTFPLTDAGVDGIKGAKFYQNGIDPSFIQHPNGVVYMTNGINVPVVITGHSVGYLSWFENDGSDDGTVPRIFPPRGRFVGLQNGQIIIGGMHRETVIVSSNAYLPRNWSAGGSGAQIRFMNAPDRENKPITGAFVFSYTTGDSGPQTYIAIFKKNSCWSSNAFPDPTSGIGASFQQMSGRVGCLAYRSIVNTPIGPMFVGSDGDVYLIRGSGEPYRVGTSIKPLLEHLEGRSDLMEMVTASFHEDFYKISYPSSVESTACDAQLYCDLRVSDADRMTWSGPHTGNVGPQAIDVSLNRRLGASSVGPEVLVMDDRNQGFVSESILETKLFRFGAEVQIKRLLGVYLDAHYDSSFNHEVLVEAFSDYEYAQVTKQLSDGSAVWSISNWDQGKWSDAIYNLISCLFGDNNVVGRTIRLRITHTGTAQFILNSISMDLSAERRKIV